MKRILNNAASKPIMALVLLLLLSTVLCVPAAAFDFDFNFDFNFDFDFDFDFDIPDLSGLGDLDFGFGDTGTGTGTTGPYVSEYDYKYLSPSQLQDVITSKNAYDKAYEDYKSGNISYDQMKAKQSDAHQAAQNVRADAIGGGYDGGVDGSEYNPFPSNGGSSGWWGGSYVPPAPITHTITATAGTGGSISPNGSTSIEQGSSQTYTITAKTGYKIADVKVDGTSIGAASTYTFSNVSSAHTINATFESAASLTVGGVTLGDDGSGTLKSGNITKSGYGFTVSLPVTGSHVEETTVTASYNFTGAKMVVLENVGGTWQFPMNSSSIVKARKIYIPVETKDKAYTITFTIKSLDPQATELTGTPTYLTATKSAVITIKGSMYEDDATGSSK